MKPGFTPCAVRRALLVLVSGAGRRAEAGAVVRLTPDCSRFNQFPDAGQRGEMLQPAPQPGWSAHRPGASHRPEAGDLSGHQAPRDSSRENPTATHNLKPH